MEPTLLFKALSDRTRLRCLTLLVRHQELCVCELTHALALAQPKVSHHLAGLRKADLVSDRKAGLWTYYRLNPGMPQWAEEVIRTTAEGIVEQTPFAADAVAMAGMPNRPGAACSA